MNNRRDRVVWLSIVAFLLVSGFTLLYVQKQNAESIRHEEMTLTAQAAFTTISTTTRRSTPLPRTSTPPPTQTPTGTPTPTPPVPTLIVHYEVIWRCDKGKPIYYIIFRPSGGTLPYSYWPSRPFAAKPGDFRKGVVTSTDRQSWSGYIVIPPHNCRQQTSSGWTNTNGRPVTAVPECQPINADDNCQTE